MYPGYTFQTALDEYAIRFFSMLNEGYRIQTRKYQMLAQISILPHIKKEEASKFLHTLDWAAKDPSDIMGDNDAKPMSREEIRAMLGAV
jgi:hypothetical protein